jgi:hypothetical protein
LNEHFIFFDDDRNYILPSIKILYTSTVRYDVPTDRGKVMQSEGSELGEREKIIWNFDNVQKAYATRGYEAKKQVS